MSKLLSGLTKVDELGWKDSEDVHYSDRISYVMDKFNFCGCGAPEEAATYIRDGLQAFVDHKAANERAGNNFMDEAHRLAWHEFRAHWPDERQRYFFWYWLDSQGLTEHGGAVPGWITDKGLDYLEALNEVLSETAE
jgi:hypothetical protein